MNIRTRLILILVLMAVVPTLIGVFGATAQIQNMVTSSNRATLEELAKTSIRNDAFATAQQIQSYLSLHPEIDLSNLAALETDSDLTILAVQPVGQTGYTAVFDAEGVVHFHANPALIGENMSMFADTLPEFWAIFSASLDGSPSEGYYDWQDADESIRSKFMAIAPVVDTPLRVASTTYIDEFTQPTQTMMTELERLTNLARLYFGLFAAAVGLVALGVAFYVSGWFTTPLREMALAADRVMQGKWDAIRPSSRQDELGSLNRALYAMTMRLQELVQGLEQEVAERTVDLERRTRYLEATTEVVRDAVMVLDLEELLERVVALIGESFGFYRTTIFLLDPTGEWAVLRTAFSEGRPETVASGLRLKVGQEGIVGYVTGTGKPYVALDVRNDPQFFATSEIAETCSEMALPLRARGDILGAIDVQSVEPEAFSEEDVAVLQTLADQVAMAISNARLFEQAQESLETERQAYGKLSQEAWRELLRTRPDLGFLRNERGISPAGDLWRPQMEATLRTGETTPGEGDATTLATPIKVRGHVIGVIDAHKPTEAGEWMPEEVALLETLTEQLGLALESARLYQDTQRRAARERLVGEITTRVRASMDADSIMQTAVRELGAALGTDRAFIRLGTGTPVQSVTSGNSDHPEEEPACAGEE